MTSTGFSNRGLERMHRVLAGHVESGEIPGMVALVARHDAVHVETLGTMFVGKAAPLQRDSIFRIASITKPIAAVAVMLLIEDCKLQLDDAIERWIPELANRRILRSLDAQLDDTVPAHRAITVRDVLTYRTGFGSVMAPPGTGPIQRAIHELRIGGDGPMLPAKDIDTDEWLRRLGSLPWIAQPGERWLYHVSGDLLGALVARVSGQRFGEFLRERLFEPLGMKDTSFEVPEHKIARMPGFYAFNTDAQCFEPFDDLTNTAWRGQPAFESGGGGLVSTVDDYLAFSRMLLHKGRHGSSRILSHASVELMTADQLTPENRVGTEIFFGAHSSWGLGVSVNIHRDEIYRTPGRYGWDGGFGTSAYIDPVEGVIGILFTQRLMDSPEPPRAYTDFWSAAYAALA